MSGRSYRIQVAAQMSGVKAPLIRAWERRYGVLHPNRTASGYRTYTDADIEVLKRLKHLTEEGVSIAEAVKLLPGIRREVKQAAKVSAATVRVPRVDQMVRWRDEILLAAEKLDQARVEAILDDAIGSTPAVVFFEELIAPLLREIGDRWHAGTVTVAEEHLVTQAARQRLFALLSGAPQRAKHHVVCACPPDEDHEVGLLGAALHFRHAGWRVTFLGARTPIAHLARVVLALKPDLVAISVIHGDGAAKLLAQLSAGLPDGTKVALGGSGLSGDRALAAKYGFRVIDSPADWAAVLKVPR